MHVPPFMNILMCFIKNKYKCVKLEGVLLGAKAVEYIEDFRYLVSCLTSQPASETFPWTLLNAGQWSTVRGPCGYT